MHNKTIKGLNIKLLNRRNYPLMQSESYNRNYFNIIMKSFCRQEAKGCDGI